MRGVFVIAFGFAILMARMVRVPRAISVVRKRQRAWRPGAADYPAANE